MRTALWRTGRRDCQDSRARCRMGLERPRTATEPLLWLVPVRDINGSVLLAVDEATRSDATMEGLAKLKPAFAEMGELGGFDAIAQSKYPQVEQIQHVHTAGNSSGIVDGAALMLIGSLA